MTNPLKRMAQEFGYHDPPSLGEYMFGAFMLVMLTFLAGLLGARIVMLLIAAFPWSVPGSAFVLAVVGTAWYSWYRDQNPKVKRVRLKK